MKKKILKLTEEKFSIKYMKNNNDLSLSLVPDNIKSFNNKLD